MEDVDKLDNIQDGFSTTSSYSFAKRPGCNISTAMCQRVIQEMVDKIKALDSKADSGSESENSLARDHPPHPLQVLPPSLHRSHAHTRSLSTRTRHASLMQAVCTWKGDSVRLFGLTGGGKVWLKVGVYCSSSWGVVTP